MCVREYVCVLPSLTLPPLPLSFSHSQVLRDGQKEEEAAQRAAKALASKEAATGGSTSGGGSSGTEDSRKRD